MTPIPPLIIYLAFNLIGLLSVVGAKELSDDESLQEASRIDAQVAAHFKRQGHAVPEISDDATFLRRVFLVTIGRIPSAEEVLFFLEDDSPDKRRKLVNYLINSKGYGSHLSNWAFDLLRITDEKTGFGGHFAPYRHWVRDAIDANMPWDELCRKLLNSSGDGWNPETAAVGYYTRDQGMPLDNLANTTRVFLGSRMECAQCHDDPFGETERREFYELAAFTSGQSDGRERMGRLWERVKEEDLRWEVEYRVGQLFWDRIFAMNLTGGGAGRIRLPSDYQYRDGDPHEWIGGRTPFGKTVRMSDKKASGDGREKFAEWVTQRTERQFPAVIANRMWKRLLGRGVFEPVDQYVPETETPQPGLMCVLVDLMIKLDYDLKEFQKVILYTQTFQFVANPEPSVVAGGDDLLGRQLERVSAEQLWDSLVTLVVGNPDELPRRLLDDRIFVQGKPVLVGRKTMPELSEEVLALKTDRDLQRYFNDLVVQIKKEGGTASSVSGESMMQMNSVSTYAGDSLVRASELPSPAPRNHLLYLFGQSDREVVEGSSREPNVGQVLGLMNGFVQEKLVNNSDAHVYTALEGVNDPREKIRRLYLATLSRPPSPEELSWMLDELKLSGERVAYQNMISALVMCSEFLFIQ